MNDVVFAPTSWTNASEAVQTASDDFARSAHPVTIAKALPSGFLSTARTDDAVQSGDSALLVPWYELVGRAIEGMNSDASKMSTTGANYQAMEEQGTTAADRFWS